MRALVSKHSDNRLRRRDRESLPRRARVRCRKTLRSGQHVQYNDGHVRLHAELSRGDRRSVRHRHPESLPRRTRLYCGHDVPHGRGLREW